MIHGRLLSVVLLALLLSLTAMAYASPPDPLWLGGFWDDDDHDDVVGLVTTSGATVEASPLDDIRPGPPPTIGVAHVDVLQVFVPVLPLTAVRAPPLS